MVITRRGGSVQNAWITFGEYRWVSFGERRSNNALAIGSSVVRAHFDPLLENEWFRGKVRHSFYLCFEYCVQAAVNWTKRYNAANGTKERIALVFDEQSEFSPRAHELYNAYKRNGKYRDWLVSICFASSKEFYPLQAADFLAYCTYDMSVRKYYPELDHRYFPVGPVFDRMMNEEIASSLWLKSGKLLAFKTF